MKNSVKNLMPIPAGYIVLTKVSTSSGMTWVVQEECGYSFRLAEYADGTTALYRVYPDGRIVPDKHSVMVHELNCPACGERMNPAVDKATGKPEPDFYGCAACGHILEFYGEEADPR